jgi:hypothetical protein
MAEITNSKDEIVSRVKEHLTYTKAIDLRLFLMENWNWATVNVDLVSEIGNMIRNEGRYDLLPEGVGGAFTYIVRVTASKPFNERHPFWFAAIIAVIGAGVALLGEWLLSIKEGREQNQRDTQQEMRLHSQDSAIDILRSQLGDSIISLRSDSNLVNP